KTFVDANISISAGGTNPVGTTRIYTVQVNQHKGTNAGFTAAPNGTSVTLSIVSGPGSLTSNPCTTTGGTGSCTVNLTSAVTGTTVVSAQTTFNVGGVSLTRSTDGLGSDSTSATNLWADDGVTTEIHDPGENVVTSGIVLAVHDKAIVTRAAGTPATVPNPT